MAIAIVVRTFPSASETFILQEIIALEKRGFELTLFAYRSEPLDRCSSLVGKMRSPVVYLPQQLRGNFACCMSAFFWALARRRAYRMFWAFILDFFRDPTFRRVHSLLRGLCLARRLTSKFGRIHAHFLDSPTSAARYASVLTGIPFSCSAHAYDIWTLPQWEVRQKVNDSAWTTTCSKAGFLELEKYAETEEKVELNYHGLDDSRFPLTLDQKLSEPGLRGVKIIAVGRVEAKKGFDILLQALALLGEKASNWSLTVIGDGTEHASLRGLAVSLGIDTRITWRGWLVQEALAIEFAAADIFVAPSRRTANGDQDGVPNVLLEAVSQGLCCVGSDVGGIPEVILDEITGRLVPQDNPAVLASVLDELIQNSILREKYSNAAKELLGRKFLLRSTIDGITKGLTREVTR